ncbi:glycosyltransferase family 4 protein [Pseudokineococcus marinus]|uniref:Glycosyltransferase family 4 protein n=1 Tax=Pseudokineococcus marinus TaxID=351215 RepID=A0A849BH37_9ACTN|nr:glycosyltransferase family 4 protein [Pseudokineococcus marinus]NNH21881.1 glycosyltransferase family 4 protein [Pseudokineococcus marinus]
MRIGYLANIYPRASDTYVREEVAALRRRGHDVRPFSMRSPDPAEVEASGTADEQRATGYLVPGLPSAAPDLARWALRRPGRVARALALAARLRAPGAKGAVWPFVYLAEALRLAEACERAGVRHVHAHTSEGPAAVAMLGAALSGGTWSMTVHGPYEWDRAPSLHLDLKTASASHVVAISEYTRGQLYRWVPPETWAKVHVVRCGVAPAFLAGDPEALAAPPTAGAPVELLCVGRLAPEKGQRLLVEGVHALLASGEVRAGDLRLRLVGDGPDRADLEGLVRRLGLEDVVVLEGWRGADDVARMLRAARALVLPSLAEGLPIALMESLAVGRPAVVSAVAGVPELVRDGENGWLVPPGDPVALAGALRRALAASPEELARMGAQGARDVRRLHDVDRSAERLEQLLTAASGSPSN